MALEIFKLVGSVFVDTDKANDSLQKTDKKAEGLGNKFSSGLKTAAKWGAGLAAAAGAVGVAMIKNAKETAANMDEIDKASKRMGIAAETYQELAYAAELCGIETSTLEKAAKKLEGTDINFDDAIESIMSLGTEEERSAAAAELFGESVAYQMSPLLAEGADGLDAMRQEAIDLGLVMSNDSVAAGAKMNDSFTKIEKGLSSLKNGLAAEFMPYIQKALDWVIQNIPKIKATVTGVINSIKPVIQAVIPLISGVFNTIKTLWEGGLKQTLTGLINFLTGVFTGDWRKAFEGIKSIFTGVFQSLKTIFKEPINWIISGINKFISSINRVKIPDWVPLVGGKGFSIPSIPLLAKGGILEKGQTGFLEGNGAEAVVPLDQNRKWVNAVAADMNAAIGGSGKTADLLQAILDRLNGMDTAIYLDGDTLVSKTADRMNRQLGRIKLREGRTMA